MIIQATKRYLCDFCGDEIEDRPPWSSTTFQTHACDRDECVRAWRAYCKAVTDNAVERERISDQVKREFADEYADLERRRRARVRELTKDLKTPKTPLQERREAEETT